MTMGDLAETPPAVEQAKNGSVVIEVGRARWRQLPCCDNEPVCWEGVKRYPPPIDTATLRRGMMFLNPDGRGK